MTEVMVMDTPADEAAFDSAASEVGAALGERRYTDDGHGTNLETAAYLFAAGRSAGMEASEARWVALAAGAEPDADEWKRIEAAAAEITDPWGWLGDRVGDSADVLKVILRRRPKLSGGAKPVEIDVTGEPQEPVWVLPGKIARRRRTMVSGDQSSAKTTWTLALIRAALTGEDFLGQPVSADRILWISAEEDADQVTEEKFKPLGFTADALRDRVRVFTRGTFPRIGPDDGNAWISREVEDFRPDLTVIDATSSAISVNSNDNDAVTDLYDRVLNPLMDSTGTALVYLHHERKGGGGGGDRSAAARGARAWSDQADFHLTLATVGKYRETPAEGGSVATERKFVLRRPKRRGGGEDAPEAFVLRGVKDRPDGATLSLAVETPAVEYDDAEQLAGACHGETPRKVLAEAVEWGGDGTGDRFTGALDDALSRGLLQRVRRGIYERGEATE